MSSHNFSDFCTLKIKKSVFSLTVILGLILSFLLQGNKVEAATINTATNSTSTPYNWNSTTAWSPAQVPQGGDIVNVNIPVNLTVSYGPSTGGVYTFYANPTGSAALNMGGGILDIRANVTLTGTGNNLNGGTIYVRSGYTLTMPGMSQATTNIIVEAGATLVINGDLLDNHGNIQVDGLITVNGNYDGQASDATVTGAGDITSTGHMAGINSSSIFGTANPYCPSNCDGRNLFGGGSNCSRTAVAATITSLVCPGGAATITSLFTGNSYSGSPVYQWQAKNSSSLFINISGATLSTYSPTPSATNDYRVVIGAAQNPGDAYCYTYSNNVTITVAACPVLWTGALSTDWNTAGNWLPTTVPTSVNDVTIPTATNKPVIATGATGNARSITINSGSSLTINSSGTLNAYGSISNSGTFTVSSGSTVAFLGSTAQTMTGVSILYNTTVNNSAGVSLSSALTVKGRLLLKTGALTTNSFLTIDIDNGGNIGYTSGDAGTVSGNVTVFRAINSITTHYISCPLNGVTAADLADDAEVINASNGNTRLFHYNNTTHAWVADNTLSASLAPTNSYSLWFPAITSVDFTGTYTHSASYTYTGANAASKFMFVSNPYPSTLDWQAATGWTKTGIKNAIYFYNPLTNSYASYISGQGTNSATQYIPAMNSFFVEYDGNTGTTPTSTIVMTNSIRSSTYQAMWRTASDETIRLTLKNASAADETVIRFNDNATNGFDNDLDAHKMSNSSLVPSIYTMSGGEKYSINSISRPYERDTIPVMIKIPADGAYVLSIKNSDPSIEYVLVDKKLGTETPVTDNDYSFTALKTDSINRFDLEMRQTITTDNQQTTATQQAASTSNMEILSSPNGFLVKSGISGQGTIEVMDVTGNRVRVLTNVSLTDGNNFFTPAVSEGYYLIKVTMNDNVSTIGHVSIVK